MRMSDREGERATLGAKRGEIPKGCWRPGSTSGRHAAGRRCRRLSPPGRMMGREGGGGVAATRFAVGDITRPDVSTGR